MSFGRVSIVIACTVCACALAQPQPPSDVELKAAFCIGYFQAVGTMVEETRTQFDSLMAGKSPEAKQKFRNDLDHHDRETSESLVRLQGYMRPKTDLDEDALLGALKRGHLGHYSIDEERNNCHSRCSKAGASADIAKAAKDCHAKCTDQWWEHARLCEDPDWLRGYWGDATNDAAHRAQNAQRSGPFAIYASSTRMSLVGALEQALKAAQSWEAACTSTEFSAYFKKTTCHARDLTPAYLSDSSTAAESDRDSLSKLEVILDEDAKAITAAYRKYGGEYGSAHGAELAAASEQWAQQTGQGLVSLRDRRITWGEYNRIRKRVYDDTVAQLVAINRKYNGASATQESYVWQSRGEGQACKDHLDCAESLTCELGSCMNRPDLAIDNLTREECQASRVLERLKAQSIQASREISQLSKVTTLPSLVESRRLRDLKVVDSMASLADKEFRLHDRPGQKSPDFPVYGTLIEVRRATERIQITVPQEESHCTLDWALHATLAKSSTTKFAQDIERIRLMERASELIYATNQQDIPASGGEVEYLGTTLRHKTRTGEVDPDTQIAIGLWTKLNDEIPSDDDKRLRKKR